MKPHWKTLLNITIISAVLLAVVSSGVPRTESLLLLDGTECYNVDLTETLNWVTSGAWWDTGSDLTRKLVLVDRWGAVEQGQMLGKVVAVSPTGTVDSRFRSGSMLKGGLRIQNPAHLHSDGKGGYVLLDDSLPGDQAGRILLDMNAYSNLLSLERAFVSPSFLPASPPSIAPRASSDGLLVLYAVYDMTSMGKGSILAFADVEIRDGRKFELASAFVYLDLQSMDFQIFERIPYKLGKVDERFNQYTRNMPFLAAVGDSGYILLFDHPRSRLVEVRNDAPVRELENFPEEFRRRPLLTRQPEMHGAVQAYIYDKILENSTAAAGLYAWNNQLYLLGKKPASPNGDTAWWILHLDPETGEELSRVRLPTDSPNLTIVPGDYWALIEKGRAELVGADLPNYVNRMTAERMVLVPDSWIADPFSGKLDPVSRLQCTTP